MRNQILAMLIICSIIVASRRTIEAADASSTLIWRGCGVSKTAFMEAAASEYREQTGVRIRLSGGGAKLGIETAAAGASDLGGTCRACLPEFDEEQLDVKLAIVAWDALAVVVHPDNPVDNITRDQVRDVLQQRLTNWSALGGADQTIVVVARRDQTSGVGHSTRQLILRDSQSDYGPRVIRLNSSGPVEMLVERQPRAIAVTGISSAKKRDLKVLSIDGHAPTVENIAGGRYPYFRPLYVVFQPGRSAETDRFVRWLIGPDGQEVIEQEGTVSLAQGKQLVQKYEHFADADQIMNFDTLLQLADQHVAP